MSLPVQYHLASSVQEWVDFVNQPVDPELQAIAVDTESTGLNLRRSEIVGVSACLKEGHAMYAPLGHLIGLNLSTEPILTALRERVERENLKVLHYNAKHDRTVLQKATADRLLLRTTPASLFDWESGWKAAKFVDVLELVYLDNPDRLEKGLKLVAKQDLNFAMQDFESSFTDAEVAASKKKVNPIPLNIATKAPQQTYEYACADADGLLRVYRKYKPIEAKFPFAVKVDSRLVDIVRRLEYEGGMEMNEVYVDEQIVHLTALADELSKIVQRMVGYPFNVASTRDLGVALFDRLGMPSQGMTAGRVPQYKTDENSLEVLRASYPVVEYVLSYKKVSKAVGTYFAKMKKLCREKTPVRFNFHMYQVPTFRFAAPGGSPDKDGFTGINIQAVSDGEARDIQGVELIPDAAVEVMTMDEDDILLADTLDLPLAGTMVVSKGRLEWQDLIKTLPYVLTRLGSDNPICIRETCQDCPANCEEQGVDTTRKPQDKVRIVPSSRRAFRAPEGWTLVSFDYDKQELVIGANISGEPKWIEAFLTDIARKKKCETCGAAKCKIKGHLNEFDLHIQTACAAYAVSDEQFAKLPKEDAKQKRDIGKIVNFLMFYGGNAFTISNRARIPSAIADQIFTGVKTGLSTLFSWIAKVQRFARKEGYTTTWFGRQRRLDWIYKPALAANDFKRAAFADRSAVNTCIQGTGAEVARIAMVRVDDSARKEGLSEHIKLAIMLHDDLTYLVRNEYLARALPLIVRGMQFFVKGWKVQLTVSGKAGQVWGQQKSIEIDVDDLPVV